MNERDYYSGFEFLRKHEGALCYRDYSVPDSVYDAIDNGGFGKRVLQATARWRRWHGVQDWECELC